MIARVLVLLTAAAVLASCTSSSDGGTPSTPAGTTGTSIATPPTTAPIREERAGSCPLADAQFVRNTMGMRLGRITILRSGGRLVGCRFYALQNSPLHASEHLPGPHQPVVQILTRRYPAAVEAHNAFVRLARRGKAAQRVSLGRAVGVCFQTDFYPKDHGQDWACATSVGRTEVVVQTVDTTGTFSTATLTRAVLRHV